MDLQFFLDNRRKNFGVDLGHILKFATSNPVYSSPMKKKILCSENPSNVALSADAGLTGVVPLKVFP